MLVYKLKELPALDIVNIITYYLFLHVTSPAVYRLMNIVNYMYTRICLLTKFVKELEKHKITFGSLK